MQFAHATDMHVHTVHILMFNKAQHLSACEG